MLKNILSTSTFHTLREYDQIISQVVQFNSTRVYEEKMHLYIQNNDRLANYIQNNLSLHKKFFNLIQKSNIQRMGLITEAWCLDACIILPLLNAIEIIDTKIEISIYRRDVNDTLMNQFLTNGSKSIPIVFGLDNDDKEIFLWGPRSSKAKAVLEPIKEEDYKIKSAALSEFYKSDLTADIQDEWIELLAKK